MKGGFDWDYVLTECPLSYKFFKETVFPNTSIVNRTILSLYHTKNLYYFFDSVGILLSVECLSENQWLGHIQLRSGFSFSVKGSYKGRIELENSAFLECFNQLEKRLNNLKNKK
jgi:hypothetical protein